MSAGRLRALLAKARPKTVFSLISNPVAASIGPVDVSVPNSVDAILETNSFSHFVEYELASGQGYGISARYQDVDNQAYIPANLVGIGATLYSGRLKQDGVENGILIPNNTNFGFTTLAGDRLGCQDNIDQTFFYYISRRNSTTNIYETVYQSPNFSAGISQSTKVAIKGRTSSGGNVVAKNVTYGPINNPLRIVSAALDSTTLKPTVVVDYTGSPYAYKISVLRPDNTTVVLAASAATVLANPSAGRATLFFDTSIPTSEYGTSPIISVAQVDASGNVVNDAAGLAIKRGASVAMPAGPVATPIAGLNRGSFTSAYYSLINLNRDMASQSQMLSGSTGGGAEVAVGDGASGMDMTGTITAIPTGAMRVLMPWRWPVGTYQLGNKGGAWPAGLTVSQAYSTPGFIVDSTNKTITITQEDVKSCALTVSGTVPAGGFRMSAYLTGEANKDILWHPRQKTVLEFLKTKVARYMDLQKNNGDFQTRSSAADFWTGPISKGISFEQIQQEANDFAVDPWVVTGWFWTPAAVKAMVSKLFTGLNPARKVWIEAGPNETWNTAFGICEYAAMDGLSKGYRSDASTVAPIALSSIIRATGNINLAGTPLVNYNAGDIVYMKNLSGVGQLLLQANRAITANNTADNAAGTTNAAWTVLADNGQCAIAMQKAYSDKCKTNIIAVNEQLDAMGIARDRVVRVVAWQNPDPTSQQRIVKWNGLGALHDAFATAPYFGAVLGNYSNNSVAGWGATEKALLNTNVPAFVDAFFAVAGGEADREIDANAANKAAMDTVMLTTYGRRARWVCYEAGQHWVPIGWPGGNALVNSVYFPTIYTDARFGTLYQRYITRWNTKCGDLMCLYDQGGIPLVAQDTCWTIMEDDLDFTQPVAVALNTVNA